jgi:peptidoglycan/xylan/chitin deacetylase (PgdA/CDA1 family)
MSRSPDLPPHITNGAPFAHRPGHSIPPLSVFLTFDVEVWCDGWRDLDAAFPAAFERYIYGRSSQGDYALPKTLELLTRHRLKATFFVEPLFAFRFGVAPLSEIVALVQSAGQEVQLHLHPEWADEARPPLLRPAQKRQDLLQYSLAEQTELIGRAKEMLQRAGATAPTAFRAGNYACNRDTFKALAKNEIRLDSSVSLARPSSGADLAPSERGQQPRRVEGVIEYPITVFAGGTGTLRQAQIGSVSYGQMTHLLAQARLQRRPAFVIVSHNFEMLLPNRSEPDPIVLRRFRKLCRFLDEHRHDYPTATLSNAKPPSLDALELPSLTVPWHHSLWRHAEQLARRALR